jgi:hypothetical protein
MEVLRKQILLMVQWAVMLHQSWRFATQLTISLLLQMALLLEQILAGQSRVFLLYP